MVKCWGRAARRSRPAAGCSGRASRRSKGRWAAAGLRNPGFRRSSTCSRRGCRSPRRTRRRSTKSCRNERGGAFIALSPERPYLGPTVGQAGAGLCMARDVSDAEPVGGRRDLIAWFESGCKAPENFHVGSEHEKIPFYRDSLSPVPYEGAKGIGALLGAMQERLGWEAIEDG